MDRKSLILLILFTVSMFFINNWFFDSNKNKTPSSISTVVTTTSPTAKPVPAKDESFYVLENGYQQIVFSNIGGAITEINLAFKTDQTPNSVVLPIEFDTIITKDDPNNALFPLNAYNQAGAAGLQTPKKGGYYPLLRRGIKATENNSSVDISPSYYGFNILSDESDELASARYKVVNFDKDSISFELSQNQRKITKTYKFAKNADAFIPYSLMLDIQIDGDTRGLSITSGVPEVEIISNSAASDIKYRYQKNKKSVIDKVKLPKDSSTIKGVPTEWVCNSNGFFGIIMNPYLETTNGFETNFVPGVKNPTRLSLIDAYHNVYQPKKFPGYIAELPFKPSSKTMNLRIFAGPFDQEILNQVDLAFANPETGSTPYFSGAQSVQGWFSFISEPFAKFLLVIMKFFYSFTRSWVLSIFLLTVVLKVILYPLNNWSMQSMARMQAINPQVQAIKARYPNDPKRANLETMQLYKEKNANPFSSCLPMFIQMPFLIGMFDLLKSAFQLRGSTFIPGWINNLTSPDVLFSWNYPIFFFGNQFHLLPFILGGLMFLQQKSTAWMNKNKAVDPEADKQAKMMSMTMTIVFTLMFYNFPAGLNIYWIFSTGLGIVQQYYLTKRLNGSGVKKNKKITT